MARFIPKEPVNFNNSLGEVKVFEVLQLLDNKHIVFHSFSWVGINKRTQGEADFVIVHPTKGIMVIEVKSGEIAYVNGRWTQKNTLTGKTKRISPFDQANRSKYEILERIKLNSRISRSPMVCHAVWFPSVFIYKNDIMPPEAPKEIVFDKGALKKPQIAIDKAFDYWKSKTGINSSMTNSNLSAIVDIIAPIYHAVPGLKYLIEEAELAYIGLTKKQASILEYLKEQKTAAIHGQAGTGKTLLAIEKAKMLVNEGKVVLFLCYNKFLKNYLRDNHSQTGIVFHNVHSLAMEILGINIDGNVCFDRVINDLEEFLVSNASSDRWPYGNVIIDEGQDLNESLIAKLYDLINLKSGSFYVFYDRNQSIANNECVNYLESFDCKLILNINCRNTAEISKTSSSMILLEENISDVNVVGKKPTAYFVSKRSDLVKAVSHFVKIAFEAGLKLDDIVVLTLLTEDKSLMNEVDFISGFEVVREKQANKILFTSVRKFKGLEAKAVLVIDISITKLFDLENKKLAYVGCSRAKHLLALAIMKEENYGSFLKDLNPIRNVPKNEKGLERLLNLDIRNLT